MKFNKILTALLIVSLAFTACKENTKTTETPAQNTESETIEDTENDLIDDNGDPIIIGKQVRATLEKEPYKKWFDVSYKEHPLDTVTMTSIKETLADTDITVFMGTWCEDSQREVPAFFKALDLAGIDTSNIHLITVSEDKLAPEEFLEGRDVEYVPTIIFEKEGKELGRIVEYSIFSIEQDMAKILNGEEYKHPYAE
ncbi:thioredoxin family protein [uncultured Dokdonia sp.]|uniref:TlpA family protein disulfide reductase n=1 Tax=uncultured Dokdonia sp. TaxID=575653 RepID=UPI0026022863|nr:thioredoxin family protein [uncultured Dokdonia sp.]